MRGTEEGGGKKSASTGKSRRIKEVSRGAKPRDGQRKREGVRSGRLGYKGSRNEQDGIGKRKVEDRTGWEFVSEG